MRSYKRQININFTELCAADNLEISEVSRNMSQVTQGYEACGLKRVSASLCASVTTIAGDSSTGELGKVQQIEEIIKNS